MCADAPEYAHGAVLRFPYPDQRRARDVHDAVAVEVGEVDDDRSRATVSRDGSTVAVRIRARDLVALRAGTNTWARLVGVAEDAIDAAAGAGPE
ncbi:KEOPS complex subunit Pcc1 [Halorarum salinum]|uniref:KEOPS complex Pcc1-like subunit n=1 Tax=Halorarum salinum TaxID=2743089 RepID=A0A7D5QE32_9EURY|nr:KEOPS complex subunit Pcc1 [Halobaculum salinum]QLG60443.1 KEOPS complex Pcc1-like subunit [Halobaculum salinum]